MKAPVMNKSIYLATLVICCCCSLASIASAQSSKGQQQVASRNPGAPASPIAQIRQQQQQQQSYSTTASSRPTTQYQSSPAAGTKQQQQPRKPQQQPQQQQQQQVEQQQQQQQQQTSYGSRDDAPNQPTEDPLADSEPALYGSVAGAPGVDFPAYTRIPKTSFTCEGKGFDFGFYADEEAQCQVYHVCWSGRRESFLCGVGTVFNQAILACDYWHSVDCSKSSQFYGVNSELGKAGAEPASGGSQRIQPARAPTASQATGNSAQNSYGSRPAAPQQQQQPQPQQQTQQQYNSNSDDTFDAPQQQQEIPQPVYASTKSERPAPAVSQVPLMVVTTAPSQQRSYQEPSSSPSSYQAQQPVQQQRVVQQQQENYPTKGQQQRTSPPPSTTKQPQPQPQQQRQRFNMDFNQKVNSLIESPVRPPIKTSPATKQRQQQQVKQQPATNYAQNAVARAQQSGSQALNPGPARKSPSSNNYSQQQQQQQQQQQYDNGADIDDQPQQQQQTFDDSPVQTSTSQYGGRSTVPVSTFGNQQSYNNQNIPQQQMLTVRSGNSNPDGSSSSAITTQYDTMTPVSNNNDSPNGIERVSNQAGPGTSNDQSYESNLDDSSNANDDFRSAGAKAAASHNQNWYIMRSI